METQNSFDFDLYSTSNGPLIQEEFQLFDASGYHGQDAWSSQILSEPETCNFEKNSESWMPSQMTDWAYSSPEADSRSSSLTESSSTSVISDSPPLSFQSLPSCPSCPETFRRNCDLEYVLEQISRLKEKLALQIPKDAESSEDSVQIASRSSENSEQILSSGRHVAKHTRPWACEKMGCNIKPFATRTDLLRHQREIHRQDDSGRAISRHLCPEPSCKRNINGFSRFWNLQDHYRRVHGATLPLTEESNSMDLELADRLNAKSPSMLRSESLDPLRQDMRARLWALQTQRRDIDSQISTLEEVIAVMDKQGR